MNNINNKVIKLTESDLHGIINESVNKVLREFSIDNDRYFGGGLPDKYFDNDYMDDNGRISENEINELNVIMDKIAEIGNNTSDDASLLFQAIDCIERFISDIKK